MRVSSLVGMSCAAAAAVACLSSERHRGQCRRPHPFQGRRGCTRQHLPCDLGGARRRALRSPGPQARNRAHGRRPRIRARPRRPAASSSCTSACRRSCAPTSPAASLRCIGSLSNIVRNTMFAAAADQDRRRAQGRHLRHQQRGLGKRLAHQPRAAPPGPDARGRHREGGRRRPPHAAARRRHRGDALGRTAAQRGLGARTARGRRSLCRDAFRGSTAASPSTRGYLGTTATR